MGWRHQCFRLLFVFKVLLTSEVGCFQLLSHSKIKNVVLGEDAELSWKYMLGDGEQIKTITIRDNRREYLAYKDYNKTIVYLDAFKKGRYTNGDVITIDDESIVELTLKDVQILSDDNVKYTVLYEYTRLGNENTEKSETKLIVVDVPEINKDKYETERRVDENNSVTLPCKAHGKPPPDITWYNHNFSKILASGKGSQPLKLTKLGRLDDSTYVCVAENIAGKDMYRVSVIIEYPPKINKELSSTRVGTRLGNTEPVYLYCVADGNPVPIYNWTSPFSGNRVVESGGTYALLLLRKQDFGSYTCLADNGAGKDRHTVLVYEIKRPKKIIMNVTGFNHHSASISIKVPDSPGGGSTEAIILSYRGKAVIKKVLNKTNIKLTNLTPYTKYEVNVTVRNEYFESEGQKYLFTTEEDIPGPPSSVTLQAESPFVMRILWNAPAQENGKITRYEVKFSSNEKTYSYNIDPSVFHKQMTGLQPYTEYKACVVAATSVGYGRQPVCVINSTQPEAPGAPQNLSSVIVDGQSDTISVRWTPPPTRGIAPLTQYTVNVTCISKEDNKIVSKIQTGKWNEVATSVNSPRHLEISQLSPYSICSGQIWEGVGSLPVWGNYSSFPTEIVMLETAPDKPRNLVLQSASHDYLQFAWDRPDRLNGVLKKFVIKYEDSDGDGETEDLFRELDNRTFYYKLSDLKQMTAYTIKVAVHTENFVSDWIEMDMKTTKGPAAIISLERKSGGGNSGPVIGGVLTVLFVLLVAALIFLYIVRKKKRFNRSTSASSDAGFFEKHGTLVDGHMPAPVLKSTFMMNDYEKNAQCTFCPKNPVPITSLKDLIQKYHENKGRGFSEEFRSIKCDKVGSVEISSRSENKCKNRYANILAYDHSRVVLNTVEDLECSDYVNANYIDGYNKKAKFIATQGPVDAAFNDFWRMIWEQDTSIIIMVTNLVEKSRIKCQKYWPESDHGEMYGNIKVELVDKLPRKEYVVRRFTITQMKGSVEVSSRTVTHYQFLNWPDHGVPQFPTALLQFVKRVRSLDEGTSGPIVCHCSGGVGRTGTYITLDAMLDQIETEKTVDVMGFVSHIRSQRQLMVQTEPQYVFIYDTLLEAVSCGDTEVNTVDLFARIKHLDSINPGSTRTYMQEEFERVSLNIDDSNQYEAALLPVNKPKNRYHHDILPFERTRVKLWPYAHVEGSDYINASFIDGYQQREAYILTQSPLENTVDDFWRMLWEYEIFTIVMISSETERTKHHCWPYWPVNNGSAKFGILAVQLAAQEDKGCYIRREFTVLNTKNPGDIRTISHFIYFNWPVEGSPETAPSIEMIGQVQKSQQKSGNSAIVIHCSDGSSRSGSLAALMYCLERLKLEGLVDVFQTVRSMRTQRKGLVKTLEQYRFIYLAVSNFLDCFSNYANFK